MLTAVAQNQFQGDLVRQRRAARRWSQADLGIAAGVSGPQIGRYENGKNDPTLGVAILIADALELTLDELAGRPSAPADEMTRLSDEERREAHRRIRDALDVLELTLADDQREQPGRGAPDRPGRESSS